MADSSREIGWHQTDAATRSLALQKKASRPYIFIELTSNTVREAYFGKDQFKANYRIKNFGNVPAKVTSIRSDLSALDFDFWEENILGHARHDKTEQTIFFAADGFMEFQEQAIFDFTMLFDEK